MTDVTQPSSSKLGRLVAAGGATILALVMSATSIVAVVWATVTLIGLPDIVLWVLVALSVIPILWTTIWTAGRAWHVEQLLEQGRDIDQPVFKLSAYFGKK